MSQNATDAPVTYPRLLPSFPSHQAVCRTLLQSPSTWEHFLRLPVPVKQELLDFCTGKHGLRITYDPVFRQVFRPEAHQERLESLLSSILNRKVSILKILPREGTRLSETGSFIIMDVLVQLDDGSYANVEMQKIGYNFPLARADCYASDVIMRQYEKVKNELGRNFTFANLHKVYCIILMEESPAAFHSAADQYIHKRTAAFDTGIYPDNAGLHEDIFICLDIFHSIVHTITKRSTLQEAWLTFLSAIDIRSISALVSAFPMFLPIYQEITDFAQNPKELMNMFSEALRIMDRNLERLMVEEMRAEYDAKLAAAIEAATENIRKTTKEEVRKETEETIRKETEEAIRRETEEAIKRETEEAIRKATAETETKSEIFRLRLLGKSKEEIAGELSVPLDKVEEVLSSLTQSSPPKPHDFIAG